MNTPTEFDHQYEPNPEFIQALEWELESTMRRTTAFNSSIFPIHTQSLARKISTIAALVIVSICLGAAGTYSVIQNDEDPLQQTIRIERARFEVDIAVRRLEFADETLAESTKHAEAGLISTTEIIKLEAQWKFAALEVQTAELNLREVQLSVQDPNDHLSAPLVEGTDFVKDRLNLQLDRHATDLERARKQLERIEKLANAGAVSMAEIDDAKSTLEALERGLTEIATRLELREKFTSGELTGPAVELAARQNEIESRLMQLALHLQNVDAHVQRVQLLIDRGMASTREIRQLELQRREVELQLTITQMESVVIEKQIKVQQEQAEDK